MKRFMFAALLVTALVALIAPPLVRAADDDKAFTIHGEVRYRGELQENASDFDDNVDDSAGFFPYRVRLAAEGKFSKNVIGWIEFQNTGLGGGEGSPQRMFDDPGSDVALYQGNLTLNELWSKKFSLRIGRQEIVAGNELLLGDEDFYGGTVHDGGLGMWKLKNVNIMVWYTRPDEANVFNSVDTPDEVFICGGPCGPNVHFTGGYATWTFKKDQMFDVYLMSLDEARSPDFFSIQTVGVRYARDTMDKSAFVWNIEVAQQTGDAAEDVGPPRRTIDASGRAIEGWFGYNWKSGNNMHRLYARFEQATGAEDDPAFDDDFEGFIPMFGEVHNRTGRGDWFRLADRSTSLAIGNDSCVDVGECTGLEAVSIGYNGFYNDRHEFGAAFWSYTAEQDNGNPAGDDLGTAFDIWYGFNYSRNLNFTISASQLSPDDALTVVDTLGVPVGGPDDEVTRVYGQARLRF